MRVVVMVVVVIVIVCHEINCSRFSGAVMPGASLAVTR
jgi:hypothetical protein